MGEVKPRILPNGAVYYPNPLARVYLAMAPLAGLMGVLIGLPFLLHVYKPIGILLCGLPIISVFAVIGFYQLYKGVIFSVELGTDYAILGFTFKKRRVHANEVKRITIDPPVYSDSLEYRYWGVMDSVCHIDLVDGTRLVVSLMANGVKLRIARVLDPQNFPVAE